MKDKNNLGETAQPGFRILFHHVPHDLVPGNGFELFFTPIGWFLGLGSLQSMVHDLLIYTDNFCYGNVAVMCFFETLLAGWLAGGVV